MTKRRKPKLICNMSFSNDDLQFQIEQLDDKLKALLSVVAEETYEIETTNDILGDQFGLIYITWSELFEKCRRFVKSYEELQKLLVRASKTFVLVEYDDLQEQWGLGYYFDEDLNMFTKVRVYSEPPPPEDIFYCHLFHSQEMPLIQFAKREYRDAVGDTSNDRIQAYIRLNLPPYLVQIGE